MNIVAIETATETVGVAVRTSAGIEAAFTLAGRRHHVEALIPALDHLLGQVGLAAHEVDALAVDVGPGLFTGLRVGVATAKGLAQGLGLGIVELTSLGVLTQAAIDTGQSGHVLSVVDARRHEVFASLSEVPNAASGATEIFGPSLWHPDALAAKLAQLDGVAVIAVGDGAQRYVDELCSVAGVTCVTNALAAPPVATLLDMAARLLAEGHAPSAPSDVVPLYLREADATANFTRIDRPSGSSSVPA